MGEQATLYVLAESGLEGFLHRCEVAGEVDREYDSELEIDWLVEEDFDNIWEERQVQIPEPDKPLSSNGLKPILASVSGEDDACFQCKAVLGLDLYNCQNWSTNRWLQRADASELWFSSPLRLGGNSYEGRMFRRYVENPLRDFGETAARAESPILQFDLSDDSPFWNVGPSSPTISKFDILRGLFDLETVVTNEGLREHLTRRKWTGLTPEVWLCQSCLTDLVKERLWVWWYVEKASGRVRGCGLQPDCWYGYQCLTQMKEDGIHAAKLNHLAVDTSRERKGAKTSGPPGANERSEAA